MPLEQIAYQFYTIESTRRVLRNIYVKNNPGEISTGPSVWMICGDAVSIMQNNEENYDYTFLVELSILFMDWAIEFEHSQGNMNFEYELGQLEDSVQVIVLPLMDFISP